MPPTRWHEAVKVPPVSVRLRDEIPLSTSRFARTSWAAEPTKPAALPVPAPAHSDRVLRAFDIGVTLLLLPSALLIGALVSLLIVIDSPGPVFFRQERVGRGGEHFKMWKFRKMRRHAIGPLLTAHQDVRFTPIGQLLTVTKLDELPQLWNVLKGDMRLVGPRPEVPEFVALYRDSYDAILSVRPGITGPAAVEYANEAHILSQRSDPMRAYEEQLMPAKIAIDTNYVQTQSFRKDLRVLAETIVVPLQRLIRAQAGSNGIWRPAQFALLTSTLALVALFVATGA